MIALGGGGKAEGGTVGVSILVVSAWPTLWGYQFCGSDCIVLWRTVVCSVALGRSEGLVWCGSCFSDVGRTSSGEIEEMDDDGEWEKNKMGIGNGKGLMMGESTHGGMESWYPMRVGITGWKMVDEVKHWGESRIRDSMRASNVGGVMSCVGRDDIRWRQDFVGNNDDMVYFEKVLCVGKLIQGILKP
ncbi:hypothetical protein Tco_0223252 [Tanacetum coccineum]